MLEKTLESPLDCKEIQLVHSEGDQPWDFSGRNDAKAETPVLWPPHAKSWLIGKDSDAGRDWRQEKKRTTEGEVAGWHHWLDGHESEWTPGVSWWWTGRPGVLQFMGSQRVRHDWATELNWTHCVEMSLDSGYTRSSSCDLWGFPLVYGPSSIYLWRYCLGQCQKMMSEVSEKELCWPYFTIGVSPVGQQ